MKPGEFRDMTPEELQTRIQSLKADLFSQRFKLATGQLENTNQLRLLRKDIARGMTILKEIGRKEKANA